MSDPLLDTSTSNTPSGKENTTVTTSNNSDFTVVIVTVGSASGSLKAEPKECLTVKVKYCLKV